MYKESPVSFKVSDIVKKTNNIYTDIITSSKEYYKFISIFNNNYKDKKIVVTNMSYMFQSCESLISVSGLDKLNITKAKNMILMFDSCKKLKSLSDISKLELINIRNMKRLFYKCESLVSLPDISIWNTINLTNIKYMFSGCSSLISLPDISKWNANNIEKINLIFYNCCKLISMPDISGWKRKDCLIRNLSVRALSSHVLRQRRISWAFSDTATSFLFTWNYTDSPD